MNDIYRPLTRDEVAMAVERRNPPRVPLVKAKWWGEGLHEAYGNALGRFGTYPDDVVDIGVYPALDYKAMSLSWELKNSGAHDARPILDDWAKLDEFVEKLPRPASDQRIGKFSDTATKAHEQNRYLMYTMWRLFYERPWEIRGMENLMTDYYLYPDKVHALNRALCDWYLELIATLASELRPDGFWTSDDLGHQTQLMMQPEIFREFLLPYYREIGTALHDCGMHWWLHSCGNNSEVLGDLADAGVDMFHPVQKGTMDERETARLHGSRIGFSAGIDVQHVLQEQDPHGVRREVRFLIDTFDGPSGGMCISAGNGIVAGTPLENIDAFLDESIRYGITHRS